MDELTDKDMYLYVSARKVMHYDDIEYPAYLLAAIYVAHKDGIGLDALSRELKGLYEKFIPSEESK